MNKENLIADYLATLPDHLARLAAAISPNIAYLGATPESLFLVAEPIRLFAGASNLGKEEEEALFLLFSALLTVRGRGSICLPKEQIPALFARLLGNAASGFSAKKLAGVASELLAQKRPEEIFGRPLWQEAEEGNQPFLREERGAIYISRHFSTLISLEEHIERLKKPFDNSAKCAATRKEKLAELLAHPAVVNGRPIELSAEQLKALDMALSRRISILAGGPGSGKTAVISTIVRLAASIGDVFPPEAIALAAPTGKAAARIMEALQNNIRAVQDPMASDQDLLARLAPASTLHRLLGFNPKAGFAHGPDNPLPARLIIVDEASMIDLFLLERLFSAIGNKTLLLLVGDPHQLPPVGAAAIFKDLYAAWREKEHAVTLSGNYRSGQNISPMGLAIPALAAAILHDKPWPKGETALEPAAVFQENGAFFLDAALFSEADFMRNLLHHAKQRRNIIDEKLKDGGGEYKIFCYGENGFSAEDEKQLLAINELISAKLILTAGHEGRMGDIKVNEILHSVYNKKGAFFTVGEPVMCTKNDYLHDIYNGDVGFIALVKSGRMEPEPMAIFIKEGRLAAYPLTSLADHLTLAHAITVHKSQGSEAQEVFLLLPEKENALLTKELLYTAATRAKKRFVVYGSEKIWEYGLMREEERLSGLSV